MILLYNLKKKNVTRYKNTDYNIVVLRHTECKVNNPIMVGSFASSFSCTTVGWFLDEMPALISICFRRSASDYQCLWSGSSRSYLSFSCVLSSDGHLALASFHLFIDYICFTVIFSQTRRIYIFVI